MTTGRLEAFSDGVLAIIITIMVLELKVPHGDDFHSISLLLPKILNYILSFIYVGVLLEQSPSSVSGYNENQWSNPLG